MLQFFFEIIVAVLAVYGGYTALHELWALICKWIEAPHHTQCEEMPNLGKEDSVETSGGDTDEQRTTDRIQSDE